MKKPIRHDEHKIEVIYMLIYFFLGRNLSFSFIEGTFAPIYARCSMGIAVCVIWVCLYQLHFKIHRRNDAALLPLALILIYLFLVTSISADGDIHFFISTYYPVVALAVFVAAAVRRHPIALLRSLTDYGFIVIAANLIDGIFNRDLTSLYSTKFFLVCGRNQLPMFTAVFCAALLTLRNICGTKRRWELPCAVVLLLSNMLMLRSASGFICHMMLIALLMMPESFKLKRSRNLYLYLLAAFSCVWIGLVVLRLQDLFAGFITGVLHKDITLTNRVFIWDVALKQIKEHLLFGAGMQPGSNLFTVWILVWNLPQIVQWSAHNQVLQELFYGGIVEALMLIAFYITCFRKKKNAFYFMACLMVVLVNHLVESSGLFSFYMLCILASYSDFFSNKNT